jgi:hypothetical protein
MYSTLNVLTHEIKTGKLKIFSSKMAVFYDMPKSKAIPVTGLRGL